MKYKIGSYLLGINNDKSDIDYLVLTDGKVARYGENGEDVLYLTPEILKQTMSFKREYNNCNLLYNYQLDSEIIKQDFPIKYNLLDYKKELLEVLNFTIDNKLMNFNKKISANGNCSKIVYHIVYNLFILINNDIKLTEEQKEIIKKIHDEKMPIEYLDEIKKMVQKLNREVFE